MQRKILLQTEWLNYYAWRPHQNGSEAQSVWLSQVIVRPSSLELAIKWMRCFSSNCRALPWDSLQVQNKSILYKTEQYCSVLFVRSSLWGKLLMLHVRPRSPGSTPLLGEPAQLLAHQSYSSVPSGGQNEGFIHHGNPALGILHWIGGNMYPCSGSIVRRIFYLTNHQQNHIKQYCSVLLCSVLSTLPLNYLQWGDGCNKFSVPHQHWMTGVCMKAEFIYWWADPWFICRWREITCQRILKN